MGGPGTFMSYGSAWANACNTPWRLYKHYGHEGGISTSFIMHWPAGIAAKGEFRAQPSHLIDIMATCVDVGGAKYPSAAPILPMEGRSLRPAFENKPIERDFLAWEHEGNRAIRSGDWKLASLKGQTWELYNIATDRTELHDLASQYPERVKDLAAKWQQWAERCNVLMK
jgi:arylsulfatase